jgi:hypothetical protein
MSDSAVFAIVSAVVAAISSLAGTLLLLYRESRQHRWNIEAEERTWRYRAGLTKQIEDNTQISVEAFNTANAVNEKIASIGTQLVQHPRLENIERTVQELKDKGVVPALAVRASDGEGASHRGESPASPDSPPSGRRRTDEGCA